MNDRYDAGYGDDQYELVGYDEYGRPVYRQVAPPQQPQQQYDPYAQQGYGYDPYATGRQQPVPPYDPYAGGDTGQQPPTPSYDPYGTGTHQQPAGGHSPPYDPYGRTATSGHQPRVAEQTAYIPQQAGPVEEPLPQGRGDQGDRDYRTEQFAFVEEPDQDSEDVIDWLKFTENRTERREEAKRRARARVVALVVVLALVAAGGVGYLWYAGKLPGLSTSDDKTGTDTPVAAQKRDVIVVHLHNTKKGGTSTALLVDNTTTNQGTTVLLPNSLAVSGDDGATTTLAKSVDDDGSSGTRDAIDTVLGTEIQGTWRLDTPYLQNLVDLVGNIEVDTNADVPDPDAKTKGAAPLVRKGKAQTLSGKTAVAYATYQASGEAQNAQLERFGQVMQAVLRKMTSDTQGATVTVQTLGMIIEPPLTDKDLGAFLAKLAELAKGGDYKTAMLPVQADGTLSAQASGSVVKNVLGGTAKSPDKDAAVRVSVQNASGTKDNTEKARVVLLNGGFTFLEGGTASAAATSKVVYADAADKANATEVAKTLGLSADAVTKGQVSGNADVSVVLGQDYAPSSS
ncbi:LytR family transcriptional regulator [Streptomyces cyaneochromogenes]|uniref:LytR family transcriptional regulator n=1 Tax=Streptomyces cyaneochromogenes TaxID=2496836 RepID=A0A3S9M6C1_9ACTN|nr:LCP family protein [Streptomyces cyaneochromogenes]AZQ34708.1 LytR family transcriptional regulator [Streptomyces cyaneochromogenes]